MSHIRVGILMGSDSDLGVMKEAARVLDELGVANEVRVISAHRTPTQAAAYAEAAGARGLDVVIAGAGGAAHLAGVIAAFTPLPVIAVPIKTPALQGLDSLLAMVQMPSGVPVATVAIDGAKNAGILAAQIVGVGDAEVRQNVIAYKKSLEESVVEKANRLERGGWENYRKS
ncbi:MAG: 5-(carboxyamino)imidazole ribonucleotide mutase [Candidatus Hydrogenedentes bacterium]|nr:5-(carboxyamino)imidazole ribonucleotide mutase [Candidatus Hydrogenedentota bacterium]